MKSTLVRQLCVQLNNYIIIFSGPSVLTMMSALDAFSEKLLSLFIQHKNKYL